MAHSMVMLTHTYINPHERRKAVVNASFNGSRISEMWVELGDEPRRLRGINDSSKVTQHSWSRFGHQSLPPPFFIQYSDERAICT